MNSCWRTALVLLPVSCCVMMPGLASRALAQSAVVAPPALSRPVPLEPVLPASSSSSSLGEVEDQIPIGARPNRRKWRLPLLGADLDYFSLLDSKTRRAFGGSALDVSPGIGGAGVDGSGKPDLDVSLLSNSKRVGSGINNKFFVLFAGVQLSRPWKLFDSQRAAPPLVPYYGASIGAIYADVNAPGAGVKGGALGATGSAFVGVSLRDRAFFDEHFSARYGISIACSGCWCGPHFRGSGEGQ